MTETERDNITSPAEGLMIYQTDGNKGFYFYDGTQWTSMTSSGGSTGGELISIRTNSYSQLSAGGLKTVPNLTTNITLAEESDVMIAFQFHCDMLNSGQYIDARLFIDGSEVPGFRFYDRRSPNSYGYRNVSMTTVSRLGAGLHDIRVRISTNGIVGFTNRNMTVKVLGPYQ